MEQQPLSSRATDRRNRPLPICRLPLTPAEAELITVPWQMALRDMVKRPMHPALEQGKEGLSSIDMDVATDVLALGVCNGLVAASEREADPMIRRRIIGHNLGALVNSLSDSSPECLSRESVYDTSMDASVCPALDQGHDRGFSFRRASAFPQPSLTANVGFIHFHNAVKKGLHRLFAHRIADAVREMPRRLVGLKAEVSLQLERGDTLLMGAHRMERLHPLAERNVRAVHYRPDRDRELLAAGIALEQAVPDFQGFRRDPSGVLALAVRTDRAFGPADIL